MFNIANKPLEIKEGKDYIYKAEIDVDFDVKAIYDVNEESVKFIIKPLEFVEHSSYQFLSDLRFKNLFEYEKYVSKLSEDLFSIETVTCLDLFAYTIHDGICLYTDHPYIGKLHDGADGIHIGYVYINWLDYKNIKTKDEAIKIIANEIKLINEYMLGNVYLVKKYKFIECDTCGGIGKELMETMHGVIAGNERDAIKQVRTYWF